MDKNSKHVTFGSVQTIILDDIDEQRKGPWEEMARDRIRFHDRIRRIEQQIGHVFPQNEAKKKGTIGHVWTDQPHLSSRR